MSPRLAMLYTHRLYYCSAHVSHVYLRTADDDCIIHTAQLLLFFNAAHRAAEGFTIFAITRRRRRLSHIAHGTQLLPSLTSSPELVLDIRSYKLTPQNHTSTACNLDCLCLIVTLTAARCQCYWLDQRIILLLLLLRSVLFCITCA